MKKQYDTSRLTNELSKSVFFQETDLAPKHQDTKLPSQQNTKAQNTQGAILPSNQSTIELDRQYTKTTKQKSTLALKHFSSYLPDTLLRQVKVLAAQRDVNDYVVLQEAVEQYLEREQTAKP